MKVKSNAKINLFLKITSKRLDGYHNLETIFQEIDLYDELDFYFTDKNKIDLFVDGNFRVGANQNNLVYKACDAIKKKFKIDKGIEINLTKNIPFGAGLGGGSSDAASCIKTLIENLNIKISQKELIKLALSFGADVPFFLFGGRCLAISIGEKLIKLDNYKKYNIVLVFPKIKIKTKEIYKKFSEKYFANRGNFCLTNQDKKSNLFKIDYINKMYPKDIFYKNLIFFEVPKKNKFLNFDNFDVEKDMFNNFEEISIEVAPEITEIKKSLLDFGAINSLMSGSGSSVFGIVNSSQKATEIKKSIENKYKNYYVWAINMV
ncbi:MAG: 4-(cytidine 5'-diphospho)-2-C-methyl-D-erythritol kinase [Elusimicrobiota bacterium]|nr:4-(cytidine 5'-diphospho)-2-C-methyl-D-erythritol kinase [Elusimicrobiota bacterium]